MFSKLKNRYLALSSVHQRVFSGAFWSLLGACVSKVIVLCATVIVARILLKSEYGEVGMVRSTIAMFMAFSSFSIGATASKYIAEYRECNKEYAVKIYVLSLVFSIIMVIIFGAIVLLSSDYIATNSFNAPHLASTVRMAAIILIFATLSGAQTGVLAGFENFKTISKINIIFGFSESLFIVAGAYFFGVEGVISGFGLANLLNFILLHTFARKQISNLGFSIKETFLKLRIKDFSILYKFSLPATISSMLTLVFVWYSKTILVQNCGFEEMANFDVAEQWRTQLLFIPAAISQIVLPILSNSKHNSGDQLRIIKSNIAINVTTTLLISLFFLCFGGYILQIYGENYTNTMPLYLMGFTGVIISVTNVLGSVCFANDKAWHICMLNGFQGILLVLFAKYFIQDGLADTGLALANIISYFIFALMLGFVVTRVLHLNKR